VLDMKQNEATAGRPLSRAQGIGRRSLRSAGSTTAGDHRPRVAFLGYAHDARGGIAQFGRGLAQHVAERADVRLIGCRKLYQEELGAVPGLELSPEADWARSAFWISRGASPRERVDPPRVRLTGLDRRGLAFRRFVRDRTGCSPGFGALAG
jgi:hypothetical protein